MQRPVLLSILIAAVIGFSAQAKVVPAANVDDPATSESTALTVQADRVGRPTLDVHINGEGPFRFIVDTAASRSAIAEPLAEQLELAYERPAQMIDLLGLQDAQLVTVRLMEIGELQNEDMAVLTIAPYALKDADGVLGLDALAARWFRFRIPDRVELREHRPVRRERPSGRIRAHVTEVGTVLVSGRAGRVRLKVLIDTGAQMSVANTAFRDAAGERRWRRWVQRSLDVVGASGEIANADIAILPKLTLGDIVASNAPVVVGDFHIFSALNLSDEPALILGMDILQHVSELVIDYDRGEVFILP